MDDLVKQARDALDGVTPGPWHWGTDTDGYSPAHLRPLFHAAGAYGADGFLSWDDAASIEANTRFIGTARDLVPAMADRIEALTADLAAAEAKLAQAVGLLRECADDLAAYVEHDFPLESRERYSSVKKRYERDMELVYETRAFLATIQPEGETDDKA